MLLAKSLIKRVTSGGVRLAISVSSQGDLSEERFKEVPERFSVKEMHHLRKWPRPPL